MDIRSVVCDAILGTLTVRGDLDQMELLSRRFSYDLSCFVVVTCHPTQTMRWAGTNK